MVCSRAEPARQRATRKYDLMALEKGEGKMFIGMGAKRDGVRDTRIGKIVELAPPERLLAELHPTMNATNARGCQRAVKTSQQWANQTQPF